jgi:glycine hydroxymethyltransferase
MAKKAAAKTKTVKKTKAKKKAAPLFPGFFKDKLAKADPKIAKAIQSELLRQQNEIELIASENIVSRAVLEAQGLGDDQQVRGRLSGPPLLRWLPVCRPVGTAGHRPRQAALQCQLRQRAAALGCQANQGVFFALLQPGDTFMGLDLACGGHLTHGSPVNQSGKWFKVSSYKVREDNLQLDYDAIARQALEVKPKLIIAGGSAYPRTSSTSSASARSPTASAPTCLSTWPTSPASSPVACIPTRWNMPMWSPQRPTRRCAARAAA